MFSLCCGKTYFKSNISYQQRKYYVSKLSKLFKEHLIIISRPLINNLTSGRLLSPLWSFFWGSYKRCIQSIEGGITHRAVQMKVEECYGRLKMSFPWELSRSWSTMRFDFTTWIKLRKITWICKWLVSKKNLNYRNRKTIFQGNGWHRRIESRVLHPHLQKSKEMSVGVNECPSHQTLCDVTKLYLEFPIYVLHTLAYLFVPLTKRKMTF